MYEKSDFNPSWFPSTADRIGPASRSSRAGWRSGNSAVCILATSIERCKTICGNSCAAMSLGLPPTFLRGLKKMGEQNRKEQVKILFQILRRKVSKNWNAEYGGPWWKLKYPQIITRRFLSSVISCRTAQTKSCPNLGIFRSKILEQDEAKSTLALKTPSFVPFLSQVDLSSALMLRSYHQPGERIYHSFEPGDMTVYTTYSYI